MKHDPDIRALLRHINRVNAFMRWLREDGDRLVAAAALLGGPAWARRAGTIVEAARGGHDLFAHRPALGALHRLLHLDLVHEPDCAEAALFASVHPDDPRADAARLCADALDRGVRATEALRRAGIVCIREV